LTCVDVFGVECDGAIRRIFNVCDGGGAGVDGEFLRGIETRETNMVASFDAVAAFDKCGGIPSSVVSRCWSWIGGVAVFIDR